MTTASGSSYVIVQLPFLWQGAASILRRHSTMWSRLPQIAVRQIWPLCSLLSFVVIHEGSGTLYQEPRSEVLFKQRLITMIRPRAIPRDGRCCYVFCRRRGDSRHSLLFAECLIIKSI